MISVMLAQHWFAVIFTGRRSAMIYRLVRTTPHRWCFFIPIGRLSLRSDAFSVLTVSSPIEIRWSVTLWCFIFDAQTARQICTCIPASVVYVMNWRKQPEYRANADPLIDDDLLSIFFSLPRVIFTCSCKLQLIYTVKWSCGKADIPGLSNCQPPKSQCTEIIRIKSDRNAQIKRKQRAERMEINPETANMPLNCAFLTEETCLKIDLWVPLSQLFAHTTGADVFW